MYIKSRYARTIPILFQSEGNIVVFNWKGVFVSFESFESIIQYLKLKMYVSCGKRSTVGISKQKIESVAQPLKVISIFLLKL